MIPFDIQIFLCIINYFLLQSWKRKAKRLANIQQEKEEQELLKASQTPVYSIVQPNKPKPTSTLTKGGQKSNVSISKPPIVKETPPPQLLSNRTAPSPANLVEQANQEVANATFKVTFSVSTLSQFNKKKSLL